MKNTNIEHQYLKLLKDILDNGVTKKDRTGTGTISVFGRQVRHDMSLGFPLLTTKKMYWNGIVAELLWFLRGDTNIRYLIENNVHIWNGDAIRNYEKHNGEIDWGPFVTKEEAFIEMMKSDIKFAKKWGDLGPVYGKQWRNWCGFEKIPNGWTHGAVSSFRKVPKCDQFANAIKLLQTDPDSRRNRVSAWNVGELDQMVLPPCHTDFQFYTRELTWEEQVQWVMKNTDVEWENLYIVEEVAKDTTPKRAISLMWNQRSVDTFLGLPFNIASYALLLEIVAKMVNMVPDELVGNLGDTHLYSNHVDQAKEQLIREPYQLPKLKTGKTREFFKDLSQDLSLINHLEPKDFTISNYQSHPAIKAPLSN